jgi:hypothetical protein
LGTTTTGAKQLAAFLKAKYWVSFGQLGQQLGPQSGLLLELGNDWDHQLQPRSGCLFERYNWEQQLRTRSSCLFEGKIMGLFWTIGNSN